jgi:hypothetical protein
MSAQTIHVSGRTLDRVTALARRNEVTVGQVVADLVRRADETALLVDARESWTKLTEDPELLAAYRAERELAAFDAPLSSR